jgi:Family of unknown function (DUF6176)
MLRVAIRRVNPGRADELREWLSEANGPRREEALATLVDEGCNHEQAFLIEGAEGPVVIYVMQVDDIDARHRKRLSHLNTRSAQITSE